MKKLNTEEIKQFAHALCFTESEAKNVTDLFYNLKAENPKANWRVSNALDSVDEYIDEYEGHWHRETNIEECFELEKDGYYYAYDPELAKEIFTSIEAFKKYAMEGKTQFVYQLPDSDMVIVVC